jgi:hypothetical protein
VDSAKNGRGIADKGEILRTFLSFVGIDKSPVTPADGEGENEVHHEGHEGWNLTVSPIV